eukprot:TRINITY_DN2241_c0_g1_i1.p3 TRINITY_DN2241_c0_g1~~TRINITY_DN2241_c0_g1_i1.p3  ORF type:complete len:165 (-),score=13.12 TRINITY_DN2241_c0_g1_i1:1239-1733(-)
MFLVWQKIQLFIVLGLLSMSQLVIQEYNSSQKLFWLRQLRFKFLGCSFSNAASVNGKRKFNPEPAAWSPDQSQKPENNSGILSVQEVEAIFRIFLQQQNMFQYVQNMEQQISRLQVRLDQMEKYHAIRLQEMENQVQQYNKQLNQLVALVFLQKLRQYSNSSQQ